MDEASRTVKMRIEVPNADRRLLAGMFATVKVFLPSPEQMTVLPLTAVLEDEGRSFVFMHHHDDYYVRRPVKLGRVWAGRVEITGGVAGGETVVSDGAFLMKSDVLRSKMGAGCAD
jgi:cobalt-zinc-cadmium efflux system membrane fusion protein